jgi:hypothetical protein
MKRLIFKLDGQRVDNPDANAIHDLVVSEFRRHARDLVAGASVVVVSGFTVARTGPAEPKQVLVSRGVAICGEAKGDGSLELGQVMSEGPAQLPVSFIGRDPGTYSVWAGFQYVEGDGANRAYLVDVAGEQEERVEFTQTRLVPTWQAVATQDGVDDDPTPAGAWVRVKRVAYDGGDLVDNDLSEARDLVFEGQGGSDWELPDFDRNDNRTNVALGNLRAWAWAVMRRLQEVNGRRWHNKPKFGENLRSASAHVTVRHTGGDETTAHYTLGDDGGSNRAALTLMLLAPSKLAGDPRLDLLFLPDDTDELALVPVDTSASGVQAIGAVMRRHIAGAANIRRTAGDNDLVSTAAGDGYAATFEGLTFSATAGTGGVLFRSALVGDRLTFRDCIFDGSGAAGLAALFAVDANARLLFERCKFVALSSTKGITFGADSEAVASFIACDFVGGSRQVEALDSPSPQLTFAGCTFVGGTRAIWGTDEDRLSIHNCYFESTIPITTPNIAYPAGHEAYANGGVLVGGIASGYMLEARSRIISFGTARDGDTLTHDGTVIAGARAAGGAADFSGRYLFTSSGRVIFGQTSDPTGLRLEQASPTVVELLDTAGGEPVASMLRMHRLLLGPSTGSGLDQLNRNLSPKAWGNIRRVWDEDPPGSAWAGTGDRAANRVGQLGNGYYESRTVRGNGTALTVRGYFIDGSGDLLEWTQANGAGANSSPACMIFRVSGLGLPDKKYLVHAWVESDRTPVFDASARMTSDLPGVFVWGKTSNEFYIAIFNDVATDPHTTDILTWLQAATEIRLQFGVFAIVDAGTFVNGGAG